MTKEDRNKIAHGIISAKELCKYCANYEKCSNFIQDCKNFQLVLSEKMGDFDRWIVMGAIVICDAQNKKEKKREVYIYGKEIVW